MNRVPARGLTGRKKKAEVRKQVVQTMRIQKEETSTSYRSQCRGTEIGYSSFKRWHGRLNRGEAILHPPGPKKVGVLDVAGLDAEVEGLAHGRHRSQGTEALYRRHGEGISRRDLHEIVVRERREQNRQQREAQEEVTWLKPALVWAMDGLEYGTWRKESAYLQTLQDMASRYKLEPIVREKEICGMDLAFHLRQLFERYGAPLFLKRDNGGNQNHSEVDALLGEYWVLPLNSPAYYAPYNGGMERTQRDFREALDARDAGKGRDPVLRVRDLAPVVVHDLNHRPRECLKGRTPCTVFFLGRAELAEYNIPRRKEVSDHIKADAARIVAGQTGSRRIHAATAWRLAAESWLRVNGFITVWAKQKVLPGFSETWAH